MPLPMIIGSIILTTMVASSCGNPKELFSRSSGSSNQSTDGFTSVSVNLIDADGLSLVGGNVSSFVGSIQGCISGWSRYELTHATINLRVPLDDRDCYFSLQEIEINGVVYQPSSAASWSVGSAVTTISDGGDRVRLSVASQLDEHITGPQSVVISYSVLSAGADQSVESSVGAAITITGASPVQMDIIEVALGIDPDDGAGLFNFFLGCEEEVVDGKCGDHELAAAKAGLAIDSFDGELDIDQCEALANSGANGSAVAAGDSILPLGGLATGNLKGPVKLYSEGNDKLMLAVLAADGACKYFKVNVIKP